MIDTNMLATSIDYWSSVAPDGADFYVDFGSHGRFYKDTFLRYAVWSEDCWQQTGYDQLNQFAHRGGVIVEKPQHGEAK